MLMDELIWRHVRLKTEGPLQCANGDLSSLQDGHCGFMEQDLSLHLSERQICFIDETRHELCSVCCVYFPQDPWLVNVLLLVNFVRWKAVEEMLHTW